MADDSPTIMTARAAALATGAGRYFSGRPCVNGHLAERYTKSGCCVVCKDIRRTADARANPEKARQYQKTSRSRHKDSIRQKQSAARLTPKGRARERAWVEKNRVKRLAQALERYRAAPEKGREKARRWAAENPERAKAIRRACYDKRMKLPSVRVTVAISTGIRRFLTTDGKRGRKTFDVLPYTPGQLVAHLERQFTPGMSWANYGQWHIDHIVPISAFNFETVEHIDFQRAWALSNLQPLWAAENHSKGARIDAPFQPSLAF